MRAARVHAIVAVFVVLAAIGSPRPALAVSGCNCGIVSSIVSAAQSALTQVMNLGYSHLAMVQMLASDYNVNAITAQTHALSQHAEALADAEAVVANKLARDQMMAEAVSGHYDAVASTCVSLENGAAMSAAMDNAVRTSERISEDTSKFLTAAPGSLIADDRDGAATRRLAEERHNAYASRTDRLIDAHINAVTFTKGTLSEEEVAAARDYMVNLVEPDPERRPSADELPGDAYRIALQDWQRRTARASLAQKVVTKDIGEHAGSVDVGARYRSLLKGMGQDSTGVPDRLSLIDLYRMEVTRRYPRPEWHEELVGASPEAVQREIASMLALGLVLQFEAFEQQRSQSLMLATMLQQNEEHGRNLDMLAKRPAVGSN